MSKDFEIWELVYDYYERDMEVVCDCCKYGYYCPRGVTSYGYGAVYPPCANTDLEEMIDIEQFKAEVNK